MHKDSKTAPILLPKPVISMHILLVLVFLVSGAAAAPDTFNPQDNILLDCGATNPTTGSDKRIFLADKEVDKYLKTKAKDPTISTSPADANVSSPLYTTARIFTEEATFKFPLKSRGWHWIRLYFYPMKNQEYDLLTQAKFGVQTDKLTLLHQFTPDKAVMKEYLVNTTEPSITLKLTPMKNTVAFVNGIELVSAPDILIGDEGTAVPVDKFSGLLQKDYQVVHRVNIGGNAITPENDTLGRTWETDKQYLNPSFMGHQQKVPTDSIQYNMDAGISPLVAPPAVYSTCVEMANSKTNNQNFNVSWEFKDLDTDFTYLVRLHFCDIVSKAPNELIFKVFINYNMGASALDLTALTSGLSSAYYKDFVVNEELMSGRQITVQIAPMGDAGNSLNAILNGIEIFKMSQKEGSLDGQFGVDNGKTKKTVAAVGFAMMFGAFVGLGAMVIKWHKRPQDWQRRSSFSSWLLPLHAGDTSFMTSKNSLGSLRSGLYSSLNLGRYFSLAELRDATNNFDAKNIIGVGGFGNVYLGEIDNGTKVAVKRGNPHSEQGITEFHTEIQMLSKLRHRHLVALIGYCDENSEMILVYEYMSHGPFRDHLYGKNLPPLSWKQRLEICIGAARGLHYLHTGTAQGIIHRDVKTTNILLDDAFVAKVADFGLSKDAAIGQGHVSTAVKGSFGYLDPEYFRKQQLTEKSDVYSFGVVLLEALCARPAINPQLTREQVNLAEWAMQCKRKGLLDKIIDPLLANLINPESMKKFAEAAEKCLAEYGSDRPSMGDVLWNLEYALQLQEAFSHGKAEDETRSSNSLTASPAIMDLPAGDTSDSRPLTLPEENGSPAEVLVINEHSSCVILPKCVGLNGR